MRSGSHSRDVDMARLWARTAAGAINAKKSIGTGWVIGGFGKVNMETLDSYCNIPDYL